MGWLDHQHVAPLLIDKKERGPLSELKSKTPHVVRTNMQAGSHVDRHLKFDKVNSKQQQQQDRRVGDLIFTLD
jgi:hypothetical protein